MSPAMALRQNQGLGQRASFVFDGAKWAATMTLRQAGYTTDEGRIAAGDDADSYQEGDSTGDMRLGVSCSSWA